MNETQFVELLVSKLDLDIEPCIIETKRSVIYNLMIDHLGVLDMGVSRDTGEPIRGRGISFEQDILIYEENYKGNTTLIPRVILEVKYININSHDVLVYSEKANRIKRVYPYVRYGLLIAGKKSIPQRVLRLENDFDFIHTIDVSLSENSISEITELLESELKYSYELSKILFEGVRIKSFRKKLNITS